MYKFTYKFHISFLFMNTQNCSVQCYILIIDFEPKTDLFSYFKLLCHIKRLDFVVGLESLHTAGQTSLTFFSYNDITHRLILSFCVICISVYIILDVKRQVYSSKSSLPNLLFFISLYHDL